MSTRNQTWLLPPDAEQSMARKLDIERMEVVGDVGSFQDVLPAGWTSEGGSWRVEAGSLVGRAEADSPALFTWDRELEGDHAIRFRGAAVRSPGETDEDVRVGGNLNCFWDYSGKVGPDTAFQLSVGGLGGWYAGMAGIEVLGSKIPVAARAVSLQFTLEGDRIYDVMAGRVGDTRFLFVDGRLIAALEVNPGLLDVADQANRAERATSRVGVSTWGRAGGSEVRIASIEVYSIPAAAVGPEGA
jgi:hypothetical protein